jgi:ketosteroid isomerase-like protein
MTGGSETVPRFDAAFNRHDLAALADLVTDDCVFEDAHSPDGRRIFGRAAVLEAARQVMTAATNVHIDWRR